MMERYKNLSGDSPIFAYEISATAITVQFVDGRIYRYSYMNPGMQAVEVMKGLATYGEDLCTYINTHVRKSYEQKIA